MEKFSPQNIPHGEIWPPKIAGKCRKKPFFCRKNLFFQLVRISRLLRDSLRLSGHQFHEHLLEAREVEVNLRVDQAHAGRGLHLLAPGEGVAVAGAVAQVNIHVEELFAGDDGGVEPGAGGQLVPQVVAALAPGGDVARGGRVGRGDLVKHLLGEGRLDGDIDGGGVDAGPVGAQDDVRGLGIEPEVELVARVAGKLRVVAVRGEAAAHEHNALGERGELRVNGDG